MRKTTTRRKIDKKQRRANHYRKNRTRRCDQFHKRQEAKKVMLNTSHDDRDCKRKSIVSKITANREGLTRKWPDGENTRRGKGEFYAAKSSQLPHECPRASQPGSDAREAEPRERQEETGTVSATVRDFLKPPGRRQMCTVRGVKIINVCSNGSTDLCTRSRRGRAGFKCTRRFYHYVCISHRRNFTQQWEAEITCGKSAHNNTK